MKQALQLVAPTPDNRTVNITRRTNAEYRTREYLTQVEVEKLMATARKNRWGHRDATMILIAYRHGLRATEICQLQWEQISLDGKAPAIHVNRVKGSASGSHPLSGEEMRALRQLQRESPASPFVFVTERGDPFTIDGFNRMIKRCGLRAAIEFPVHAHMLRHACGYALANKGTDTRTLQAYLGHRSINSTVRYAELAPGRFKGLWD
jgi:integrase